jgi:hypothetical protein
MSMSYLCHLYVMSISSLCHLYIESKANVMFASKIKSDYTEVPEQAMTQHCSYVTVSLLYQKLKPIH